MKLDGAVEAESECLGRRVSVRVWLCPVQYKYNCGPCV